MAEYALISTLFFIQLHSVRQFFIFFVPTEQKKKEKWKKSVSDCFVQSIAEVFNASRSFLVFRVMKNELNLFIVEWII